MEADINFNNQTGHQLVNQCMQPLALTAAAPVLMLSATTHTQAMA